MGKKNNFLFLTRMRLKAEKGHQIDKINWEVWSHWRGFLLCEVTRNTLKWMILCYSSVNSTYPSRCEEMPVSVRCIAIGCKCFLSFCKQVISTSGTKHFIGKAETSLNWANFGTSHRMLLTGHFQRTDGIEKERSAEETNTAEGRRGAPKRRIQRWTDGPLHYVLSRDGEICIWDLSNILKLWSFTIDKCKKMATSLRQKKRKGKKKEAKN